MKGVRLLQDEFDIECEIRGISSENKAVESADFVGE